MQITRAIGEVHLIDSMGSDLTVVNAARVSFAKESNWNWSTHDPDEGDGPFMHYADEQLIKYLAEHKHWTPFSHVQATFRVKAPLFVARQLFKHKVGLTENEISRRYVSYEPEIYLPMQWRSKPVKKKQGSGEPLEISTNNYAIAIAADSCAKAVETYDRLLKCGVAPEQARMVLPLNMMTEWYWTGSLAAFARVAHLRLSKDAQGETGDVVSMIVDRVHRIAPRSWAALISGQDHARD